MPELEIELYSYPLFALHPTSSTFDVIDYPALPEYDIQLLKPALLFGDKVNLVTFRETLQQMLWSQAKTLYVMPMQRFHHLLGVARVATPKRSML